MTTEFKVDHWYSDGKRAFRVVAIEGDRLHVVYQDETEPVRRFVGGMAQYARPLGGPPLAPSPPSESPRAASKGRQLRSTDDRTFSIAETSAIIADVIRHHGRATGDYLPHDEIVRLFLADAKGASLVARAIALGHADPPAKIAGNMLDHFSAHITAGHSEFAQQVERRKIGGKWAYRPR